MTTLVTGGIGWVPSHIVRTLATSGEPVIVLDLMEPDDLFWSVIAPVRDQVTVIHGDTTDLATVQAVVSEHGVDAIVHAAAITPRREREMAEPERIIAVNLGALINVLQIARTVPTIRRTLFISSGSALGDVQGVAEVDEDTPSAAVGLYGVLKHTGERIVRRYRDLYGLDALSVRLANVYGPMERITPGYSGATELREMLRIWQDGETIRINSAEGPYLDWTYVDDIADGIRVLMEAEHPEHDLYTLTCGQQYSMGAVLEQFAANLPDFRWEVVEASSANYSVSGDAPGPVTSGKRMLDEFGWSPATSFDDGMRMYLAWIQQHGAQ